jgi:SAM-dependent methyltransferase
VTRALPDDGPVDVLDVGCGTGRLLDALARRRPDATLTGVDLHPRMVDIARERLRGTDRATVVQGDALDLDGSYDAVAAFNLLPHFDDDELRSFFETAASLLPPDGALALDYKDPRDEVDGAYDRWATETEAYEILTRFLTVYDEGQSYYAVSYQFVEEATGETHSTSELMEIHFQTPELLESRLDAAGFGRVEVCPGVGDQSGIVVAQR